MPLLRPVLTSDYTYETLVARLYEYVDVRKGMRHTQSGFRYTIFEIVVRYEMPSYTRFVRLCEETGFSLKIPGDMEVGKYW
jgi:hypothetical protein